MSRLKDPEFRRLQREYYNKLKSEGFRDIENEHGQLIDHQSAADFSQRASFKTGYVEITQEYYTWASSMIEHGRFVTRLDHHIWTLHSEGKSSREIQAETAIEQTWVCRKIKKIRMYLKAQAAFDEDDTPQSGVSE